MPRPRGLYATNPDSGETVYRISDAAKGIVEAYVGTNTALTKARTDLKDANAESASRRVTRNAVVELANSVGVENVDENDPITGLKSFIENLTTQVKGGKEVRINLDKMKAEYDTRLNEAVASKDAEIAKKDAALSKYLIDQAATAALAKATGSVSLLLPHVKARAKVVQDGEDYVVRVLDAQGDVRGDGKGGFMTVEGFVAEMKTQEEFGRAFESETAGGSGARPGSMQQRPAPRSDGNDKSALDKISAGLRAGGYTRGVA